jgi:hypothetical protein
MRKVRKSEVRARPKFAASYSFQNIGTKISDAINTIKVKNVPTFTKSIKLYLPGV